MSPNYRILNVLFDARVGGPQSRVLQVAGALRMRGWDTVVVIPRGEATFSSLLVTAGIRFDQLDLVRLRHTWNPMTHGRFLTRFWRNVEDLRQLIRWYGIQIVHTNGLMNLQAAVAARREGVRLVWHLNDVSTPRLLRLLLSPIVRRWADRIVVAAQAVERHYFPNPSDIADRVHVIYAPVDTEKFCPNKDGSSIRAEFGICNGSPILGTVCNLSPGKGVEFLLEAVPAIMRRFPSTKFLVVGEMLANRRSYWSSLVHRVQELGLGKHVIFTGRREDIPRILAAMTGYVHPSEAEACPMAVLEASASGLPVVATDVGGTRELVDDGVTGVLVTPRSPAQIARAVIDLLESPEAAQKMGLNGADRMRSLFSLKTCVEAHIRAYTGALEHHQDR